MREERVLALVARIIETTSGGHRIATAMHLPEWPRVRRLVLTAMRQDTKKPRKRRARAATAG